MKHLPTLTIALIVLSRLAVALPIHAQSEPLTLLQTLPGHFSGDPQSWTFSGAAGGYIGARVSVTAGDVLLSIECQDAAGKTLARGTHTGKTAAIDGLRLPADAVYSLIVSSAHGSSGDFTLTLLPGYSTLVLRDAMDGANRWRQWQDAHFTSQISGGKLRLQFSAANRFTWTTAEQLGALADGYVQADVRVERQAVYSEYGLLVRGVAQPGGLAFYVFIVNSEGKYRFALSTHGGLTLIADWTALPSPAAADALLTLAVWAHADKFALFYNGQPLATLTDATLTAPGQIGLVIGTGLGASSTASVLFSGVIVTAPSDTAPMLLPTTLIDWQRAPERINAALQAAHVLNTNGKLIAAVPQTALSNYVQGMALQPLAKGAPAANVVLIADVSWDSAQNEMACGLAVRYTDADNFALAYIDRKGGYGLYRVYQGHTQISEYDLNASVKVGAQAVNRLILIANGDLLALYVNGTLASRQYAQAASGGIALVSYNYQPLSARCTFENVSAYVFDSGVP